MQRNLFGIWFIEINFGLYLHFSEKFGTKRNTVWCFIYQTNATTTQIWFGFTRLRKDFSVALQRSVYFFLIIIDRFDLSNHYIICYSNCFISSTRFFACRTYHNIASRRSLRIKSIFACLFTYILCVYVPNSCAFTYMLDVYVPKMKIYSNEYPKKVFKYLI